VWPLCLSRITQNSVCSRFEYEYLSPVFYKMYSFSVSLKLRWFQTVSNCSCWQSSIGQPVLFEYGTGCEWHPSNQTLQCPLVTIRCYPWFAGFYKMYSFSVSMVRRRISEAQRWQIIGMHTTGMSFKAIGRQLGYHYTVVSRLVEKHTQTNNVKDMPRSGPIRSVNILNFE
jgi:hypothetical protein